MTFFEGPIFRPTCAEYIRNRPRRAARENPGNRAARLVDRAPVPNRLFHLGCNSIQSTSKQQFSPRIPTRTTLPFRTVSTNPMNRSGDPMTTATRPGTELDSVYLSRILAEGYGPGAWHGPDLAAALSDVSSETAFTRPAPGRHNIAEIAVHHAWCARNVAGQLTADTGVPFPLEGDDWFPLESGKRFPWSAITKMVAEYQAKLADALAVAEPPALADAERFALVLGITCHAVYHAGQIQLIKRLLSA
jgi:DinB superfamily